MTIGDVYRRLGDMHTTMKRILEEIEKLNGSNSKQIPHIRIGRREKKPE
jgi:hypothetical protein